MANNDSTSTHTPAALERVLAALDQHRRGILREMTDIEKAVLKAVRDLQPNAYGVTIHSAVEAGLRKSVSYGKIYLAIDFLEAELLISTSRGGGTPERGGRPKLYVFLEIPGERALNALEQD